MWHAKMDGILGAQLHAKHNAKHDAIISPQLHAIVDAYLDAGETIH